MVNKLEDADYIRFLEEDDDYIRFMNDETVCDSDFVDPDYKVFLDHLIQDGKSYVFEMMDGENNLPGAVRYEDDELPQKEKSDSRMSSSCISFEERYNSVEKTGSETRPCSNSDENFELSSKLDEHTDYHLFEDSYKTFLNHVMVKRNSMILEIGSHTLTYEEEEEASMSSEILEPENTVNSTERSLIPYERPSEIAMYEGGNRSMVSVGCDGNQFKTKLMALLEKPYDQVEYEDLLREATERKPLTKQKHLRSMSVSYATKEVGYSYFDHFPDLAEQVSSADNPRKLKLLRGFFFWLKNLSHEGAYMPWASSGYELITEGDYEVVLPLDMAED